MHFTINRIAILGSVLLLITGTAQATTISESIYARVVTTTVSDVSVGDEVYLFDVTYDDASSNMNIYWNDGSLLYTYPDTSTYANFASDAEFSLSPTLQSLIGTYGGYEFYTSYQDNVWHNFSYSLPYTNYYTVHNDYRLVINDRDGLVTDYGTLWIVSSESDYEEIGFSNVRTVRAETDGAAPVPEPSTMLLLGSGLAGLSWYRRKRKQV